MIDTYLAKAFRLAKRNFLEYATSIHDLKVVAVQKYTDEDFVWRVEFSEVEVKNMLVLAHSDYIVDKRLKLSAQECFLMNQEEFCEYLLSLWKPEFDLETVK